MHIFLMLILVILGLALSDKVGVLIGGPICILGLACFEIGSKKWRESQENLLLLIGLICLFLTIIGYLVGL
ncbi:hypothetical protein CWC25_12110 [Pseudoalteromonas sp. S4389]|nr:hypothetical protein CWC25_12110 [Pseudoalteromonas sp. S4389]